jgi:Bardet-Biedl syndrome 5 protein
LAENFNVSIPYLQIKGIKVRDSKFGHALVVETTARSGGYILGFRVDPYEKLSEVFKEIKTLHEVYSATPNFGIRYAVEDKPASSAIERKPVERKMDDVEIVDDLEHFDALATYYAEGDKNVDREPVFAPELGLAVEKLREGVTLEDLWSIGT